MPYRTLSLATKISTALVGLLLLAAVSSAVAITSAYRFEAFQETLVVENLASVRAAEELEIALLEQRGYVSSYVLDRGQGDWLDRLSHKSKDFDYWLKQARETARTDTERELLDRLEAVQHAYAAKRHRVVELYDQGREEEARGLLLGDVVKSYEQSYNLCEEFIAVNQQLVSDTSDQVRRQVEQVTVIVSITAVVTLGLGTALLWLFFTGVVFPLRRIANDARLFTGSDQNSSDLRSDEMRELGHFVKLLITNVTETRSDLEKSRSQLAQAEKLAAVGKLAASVAHDIRNPLTSMKMWLYSLRRAVGRIRTCKRRSVSCPMKRSGWRALSVRMLVLSRKVGEEIVIANQVRIRVAGIEGKRVKLAISAPDDISVFRGEIRRQRCALTPEHELLVSIGE